MKLRRAKKSKGFTLVELLVVLIMIGILSTIAAPAWFGFLNNQRLGTAQNQVYLAMREAQSNARRTKQPWYAVFRQLPSGQAQYSVLQIAENINVSSFSASSCDSFPWRNLESSIRLSYVGAGLPNLGGCTNAKYLKFDKDGNLGNLVNIGVRITSVNGGGKRCVVTTTILGAIRQLDETSSSGCSST